MDDLRRPLALEGMALNIEFGMGVSIYPRDGSGLDRLLQAAALAAAAAYESSSGQFQFYSAKMAGGEGALRGSDSPQVA